MKAHLSDQQMIDYHFELSETNTRDRILEHLEGCETCRRRLDELTATLTQLDSLKDATEAPEQLIAQTLRTIRSSQVPHILPFPKFVWLSGAAAAAAVVIAALILSPGTQPTIQHARPAASQPSEEIVEVAALPAKDHMPERIEKTVASERIEPVTTGMLEAEELDSPSDADVFKKDSTTLAMAASVDAPQALESVALKMTEPAEPVSVAVDEDVAALPETMPDGPTHITVLAMANIPDTKTIARSRVSRPRPSPLGSFFAGRRTEGAMTQSFAPEQDSRTRQAPQANHAKASVSTDQQETPPITTVEVPPTEDTQTWQMGPNQAVRVTWTALQTAPSSDSRGQRWRVSAVNDSEQPAQVIVTREGVPSHWAIQVSDGAKLTIPDDEHAEISMEVPPHSERSFEYRMAPLLTEEQ